MTMEGQNKMAPPATTKTEGPKTQGVRYVGHQPSVHAVVDGRTHRFPWSKVVEVPPKVAEGLLKQPEKFQPGSGPELDPKNAGKRFVPAGGK